MTDSPNRPKVSPKARPKAPAGSTSRSKRTGHAAPKGAGTKRAPKAASAIPESGTAPAFDVRLAALPMLAGLGVLIGTWALLPRYVGPRLELGARGNQLEFVDHVIPGALVIVVALAAALVARRPAASNLRFAAGLVIVVAGLWMDATHFPLVLQAWRDEAPWGATLHHSLPGVAVTALGIAWCLVYRTPSTPPTARPTAT